MTTRIILRSIALVAVTLVVSSAAGQIPEMSPTEGPIQEPGEAVDPQAVIVEVPQITGTTPLPPVMEVPLSNADTDLNRFGVLPQYPSPMFDAFPPVIQPIDGSVLSNEPSVLAPSVVSTQPPAALLPAAPVVLQPAPPASSTDVLQCRNCKSDFDSRREAQGLRGRGPTNTPRNRNCFDACCYSSGPCDDPCCRYTASACDSCATECLPAGARASVTQCCISMSEMSRDCSTSASNALCQCLPSVCRNGAQCVGACSQGCNNVARVGTQCMNCCRDCLDGVRCMVEGCCQVVMCFAGLLGK